MERPSKRPADHSDCLRVAWAHSNWQSFCVGLPDGCDQRLVMQAMLDAGVSTRRGVMCIHREPAYACASDGLQLPVSERVQDRCILLPLYPGLSRAEQRSVVDALATACRSAQASAA